MRREFILAGILIILAFISGIIINRLIFTGKVIEKLTDIETQNKVTIPNRYTWTRAICNEKNGCVDVEITCRNGKVESINLLSNILQNPGYWEDPRNINASNLCK